MVKLWIQRGVVVHFKLIVNGEGPGAGGDVRELLAAGADWVVAHLGEVRTEWVKMTQREATEFSELVGLDHTICESCRSAR